MLSTRDLNDGVEEIGMLHASFTRGPIIEMWKLQIIISRIST